MGELPIGDWFVGDWLSVARITLAALLGAIIGFERERSGHPAGLRTNMLVSVGSCLFTILSIDGFPLRGTAQDSARVAAQIVVGVGFLGAGVVIHTGKGARGLTTAASIWLNAAVGMAVGVGAYILSIYTTLLVMFILVLRAPGFLDPDERRPRRRHKVKADAPPAEAPHGIDHYPPDRPRDD